jgi:hypothetical protein
MAVYVDDMYKNPIGEFGRMKMSHMIADSTEELLTMARKIGVNTKWIQDTGTGFEHFDIAMAKRELAIKHGAIQISMYDTGRMNMARNSPNEKLKPVIHQ